MSWFQYKDQHKRYRKGLWLRIRALPKMIRRKISDKLKKNEMLSHVVVRDIEDGRACLECWCYRGPIIDRRYTVFYVETVEDPEWICEGDMGRRFIPQP